MNDFVDTYRPLIGLGMVSLVLGTVALILFFLPVLGIPISALGLLFGLVGFGWSLFVPRASLRWGLAGVAMSSLALLINVVIVYAPEGSFFPSRSPPQPWQPALDRPYVPPPAGVDRTSPTP